MFSELIKATVGLIVETPISLVKDGATMFGALTDQDKPYTIQALEKVADNVSKATD